MDERRRERLGGGEPLRALFAGRGFGSSESGETMADYCTKCGTTINPGYTFCTSCGAPVAGAAASAYATTASGAAPVAAPQGGNSALKIILIVVGVFVGLGMLSVMAVMFGLWHLSRSVHVGNNGNVTLSTPEGTLTAGSNVAVSEEQLGVAIYPGAMHQEGGLSVNTARGSTVSAVFSTSDPADKVVAFYKDKLGSGASVFQSDKSAILSTTSADSKETLMVTVGPDNSGQTKISIVHSKAT